MKIKVARDLSFSDDYSEICFRVKKFSHAGENRRIFFSLQW